MSLQSCTLIGGAPFTGKSTLARSVAEQDGGVLVASDAVRDWMQAIVRPEDRPALFFGRGLTPDALHNRFPMPQDLLHAQLEQGQEVQRGVTALLQTRYLPWERVVVEGVAITPAYMVQLTHALSGVDVEIVVLRHADHSLRDRLRLRGLWSAEHEPDADARHEIAWLEMFDRYICDEAEQHSLVTTVTSDGSGQTA